MFGRFGWAEILVIVVLVLILFGSNKIPGMMKNLADGINIFKKEIKDTKSKKADAADGATEKSASVKKAPASVKKTTAKKSVAKKSAAKLAAKPASKSVVKKSAKK